jgi:nitrite reductase/ring-hydroxylating ferredoxin subunit
MSSRVLLSDAEAEAIKGGRFIRVELGRWVRLPLGLKAKSALVGRAGGKIVAYANVCMHNPLPLDLNAEDEEKRGGVPSAPMAEDGVNLLCHSHGAIYRPRDGMCVSGPCAGMQLVPMPIDETAGTLILRIP